MVKPNCKIARDKLNERDLSAVSTTNSEDHESAHVGVTAAAANAKPAPAIGAIKLTGVLRHLNIFADTVGYDR